MRVFVARDAGEQALAGVRAAHATGLLAAVQGQDVAAELVRPESLLESLPQTLRLVAQCLRELAFTQFVGQLGRSVLRSEDVRLDLAQRDRPLG
jgi:hypothetical protein